MTNELGLTDGKNARVSEEREKEGEVAGLLCAGECMQTFRTACYVKWARPGGVYQSGLKDPSGASRSGKAHNSCGARQRTPHRIVPYAYYGHKLQTCIIFASDSRG
jgi:hypothetical protein